LSDETETHGGEAPAPSAPAADTARQSGDGAAPAEAAATDDARPAKKRRRRRRKKKPPAEGVAASGTSESTPAQGSGSATADASASLAALAGGLLSHIDDREVPCSVDGCDNHWVWSAAEQIQSFGKPPPKRMCSECRAIEDQAVRCSVDGCRRTWTWSRDAQLKHRAWARRHGGDSRGKGKGKKRRRRGRGEGGPPRRMCEVCQSKLSTLAERETVCKVHGCTRTVKVERELQLRAWAALRTDDLEAEFPLPKKMCEVCRDFCRMHPDREVSCGRPGCDGTWTYKTGAQLQAFLAGRLEDPIRLCETCAKGGFAIPEASPASAPHGAQTMPCVVLGCTGTWLWHPKMNIQPASPNDPAPIDRLCDEHRVERGASPRAVESKQNDVAEPTAEQSTDADETSSKLDDGLEPAAIGMNPEGDAAAPVDEAQSNSTDRSSERIVVESVEAPASE
jgi:hypothetical protein